MKDQPKTLLSILETETEDLYSLGYEWLVEVCLPLIDRLTSEIITIDLVELYQILGEIYQESNAYEIAQEYYNQALSQDGTADQSHYALAYIYEIQGKYYEALSHLDTLLDIYPDNPTLQEDKARMQENIIYDTPPFIQLEDSIWQYYQELAKGNAAAIIAKLKNTKDVVYYRVLLMAYGIAKMEKAYLVAWQFYCEHTTTIDFEKVDWFYMPKSIYNQPQIWEILLANKHKVSREITFIEELDNELLEERENLSEGIALVCKRHIG
jgi:tetratricopeptide (TPR) repeat protein